jgi:hypothetical protein
MLPLAVAGSIETSTAIDNAPEPEPDVGVTVSHGESDATVHVTVLCVPLWTIFTVCAGVRNVPLLVLTLPKFSFVLSTVIVGRLPVTVIVNVMPLLVAPPTVTVTFPVVAPLGTVAAMLVADHDVGVAVTPLNFTALVPCVAPKFAPVIVTDAPTAPLVVDSELIVGIVSADTIENGTPLLARPPTVTTTSPVVAPLGTRTVMLVSLQAVGDALTPLNDTVLVACKAPNPEPAITTEVPTGPDEGVTLELTGAVPLVTV